MKTKAEVINVDLTQNQVIPFLITTNETKKKKKTGKKGTSPYFLNEVKNEFSSQ